MADPRLVGTVDGLTKASWGTGQAGTSLAAFGYVYKATIRRAGEDDKVYDGNGFTIGQIFFDDQDEVEFEILAKDAAALPERGDVMTFVAADADLNGLKGVVQDADKEWGYRQWKMLKVKATQFANMTFPA